MKFRNGLMTACAFAVAIVAPHTARAQTPIRFSGAVSLGLPIGDLGNAANLGYGLTFRGEGKLSNPEWGLRGDINWDRFPGKFPVDAYSYLSLAGNFVHRMPSESLYEFAGLGLYNNSASFNGGGSVSDTNLGLQLGVGLDLAKGPHTPFVEFGLTSVFTSGANTLWFPVRFGIRF
ncbi:MAG: outer membrane beta-barrel protein [Gemmatimonadales bacterium]